MNILLTGSTSQQCNPQANRNVINFAGLLRRAFHASGHDVYWKDPSLFLQADDLLTRYDHIIVGLAPVTSLGANRIYGALSIIGHLMAANSTRWSILIDSPDPERIAAGNRAILAHPENLMKTFYSYRKEYEGARHEERRLLEVIRHLHESPWPRTIVPVLPWETEKKLPYPTRVTVPLNLDRLLFENLDFHDAYGRQNTWTTEGNTRQPVTFVKRAIVHRGHAAHDPAVMRQMATGVGVLLESPKEGLWWNSRYAQAISTQTPVFSDWRRTKALGDAWSVLPMMIETMSPLKRQELARAQSVQYRDACASDEAIQHGVYSILKTRAKASV